MGARAMTTSWRELWAEVGRRHEESKDNQGAIVQLLECYVSLDAQSRAEADRAIFEALLGEDETKRYDALAIINAFQLQDAIPHLLELAARLQLTDTPGAPFELAKVERIIAKLRPPG